MKTKQIMLNTNDVPNVSDVVCICEPRGEGGVTVLANAHGRNCLQKVFPAWSIPFSSRRPVRSAADPTNPRLSQS